MKNKHLVLMFLGILALGLISRLAPFAYRNIYKGQLLQVDTLLLSRIIITTPEQADLTLERVGTQWIAEQTGRNSPVVASEIRQMLQLLSGVGAYQTVHSLHPDTLGFGPTQALQIQLFQPNKKNERFEIGAESENPSGFVTYLRLPNHNGIYATPGAFRSAFFRNLDDFRSKTAFHVDPDSIRKISVRNKGATPVYLSKNDALGAWVNTNQGVQISADSVRLWLQLFENLNNCDFSDSFDETREQETLQTTVMLDLDSGTYLKLRFFYQKPPNLPEDITRLRKQKNSGLASFVLHSSQNPLNFFVVSDSNLVRQICTGLQPFTHIQIPVDDPIQRQ